MKILNDKIVVLAIIILLSTGCSKKPDMQSSDLSTSKDEETYKIGTIFTPKIYTDAFKKDHIEKDEYVEKYKFQTVSVGNLTLNSGELVIAEPFSFYDQVPSDITINSGIYKVLLAEALIYRDGKVVDKRNAFAKIILAVGEATSWEYIGSFWANGGTGGYIDYQVMLEIVENYESEYFVDLFLSKFDEIYKVKVEEPFHLNHDSYKQYVELKYENGNLLAFNTGWGDGAYDSYIGYDSTGKPVEVLTDLGVIDWNDKENLQFLGEGESKYSSSF